jgi:gluconolactonase
MLKAPNDIVFDPFGGFYFTDSGKSRERERDYGGIYYAMADGSRISEVAFPMWSPNGIGLSADSNVLYVSETESGRLWAFDIIEPGVFEKHPSTAHGGRLVTGLPGFQKFDGLALDEEGFVYVTTPVTGAITVIGPDGSLIEQQFVPDSDVTNICFGGADRRTLYITLGNTGQLIKTRCQRAGLPLTY